MYILCIYSMFKCLVKLFRRYKVDIFIALSMFVHLGGLTLKMKDDRTGIMFL